MSMYIPTNSALDSVYLHIFYGDTDAHYVANQSIARLDSGTGYGTYRLIPPAGYARAWAISTRDLYVADAATGKQFIGVFTIEPISGIITVWDAAPPANILVTYRYYGGFISVRVKNLKKPDPQPSSNADIWAQPIYPLQTRFPESVSFDMYGVEILGSGINMNLIKSYLRKGIRDNLFFLIIDDNSCQKTFNSAYPSLMTAGWAAEGPLFCDQIDLIDRGGDVAVPFKMQPHQFGNYYWFTSITPTGRWWPQALGPGGGSWGWEYWKGDPMYEGSGVATPTIPYAWPPDDWWEFSAGTNLAFSGVGLNDLSIGVGSDYTGFTTHKKYEIRILNTVTSPDEFIWTEDGGATWHDGGIPGSGFPITGGEQTLSPDPPGYGVSIKFTNVDGHTVGDSWTFEVYNYSPVLLPPLPFAPGGWIEWLSNLPQP